MIDDKIVISRSMTNKKPNDGIRNKAKVLANKMKEVFIDFAEIMYHVKKNNLWKEWGFVTFKDYVVMELKLSRTSRTIDYFIDIYENLCVKLNKDKEDLRNIPWTNVREIPRLIRKNIIKEDNVDEWLEKAKNSTQNQFTIEVKRHLTAADLEDDVEKYVHKTFIFKKNQMDNINVAIQCAMEMSKVGSENLAIDNICLDFNSRHASFFMQESKDSILRRLLKDIEDNFNVNILAISDNNQVLYGDFLMLCNLYNVDSLTFKFLRNKKDLHSSLLEFYNKVVEKYGEQDFSLRYNGNILSLEFSGESIDMSFLTKE